MARARLQSRAEIPFARKVYASRATNKIQFIQNTKNARAVAAFHNALFAATESGLLAFDAEHRLQKRYTTLDGLPKSDLTSLAVAHDKLYIGTRASGLVAFDGARFESFRWLDRQAGAITALQEASGDLFIGTFAGGLIRFDGKRFQEIVAGAAKERIRQANFLRQENGQLYIGTFDDGLWLNDAGVWRHFTASDGLPSNRIVGMAQRGGEIFIATDFGLARINRTDLSATIAPRFQVVAVLPSLSGIAEFAGNILLCQDDGALFMLMSEAKNRAALKAINLSRPQAFANSRLNVAGDELLLTTDRGIYRVDVKQASAHLAPFVFDDEERMPASNLVSALAFDDRGRLWAGNFRGGLDVFEADGRRLARLETEELREINALIMDHAAHQLYAATAHGVWRFDDAPSFNHAQQITLADGLLSNAVMHLAVNQTTNQTTNERGKAPEANAIFYATSRGLSFGEKKNLRALTTMQGLPSNNIYALLRRGARTFVGTLGGLALIENGRVARVFRDDNSRLAQNWVTSLCASGERIFIGTYGGGVFELTAAGELNSFASEIGKQTVNPNAMWSDDSRLYVGTLDGAWILDLRTQRWTHLKDALPSSVVLSVTANNRAVYFGTTAGIARAEISYFDEMSQEGRS